MATTDIFLSHDWGIDEELRHNHDRVANVNKGLKSLGFRTWFDGERMHGDIAQHMAEGIENTKVVIVFVTGRYIQKVNGSNPSDNCKLEFNHSARHKTSDRMLCVVMENGVKNSHGWKGMFGMYLAGKIYIDMSGDLSDTNYLKNQLELLKGELEDMGVIPCPEYLNTICRDAEEVTQDKITRKVNEMILEPPPQQLAELHEIDLNAVPGEAKATSVWSPLSWNAAAAFERGNTFWHSGIPHLPQSVWFVFEEPVVVAGFSFKSSRDSATKRNGYSVTDGPSKYQVFATNAKDGSDTSQHVVLFDDDSGTPFSTNDEAKTGIFTNMKKYGCYGIRVIETPGRDNGEQWVNMSSLTFYSPNQIRYQDTFSIDLNRIPGDPKATSYYSPSQNADAAFKNGSNFWHSGTPDLPQAVWFEFNEPIVIVGFSFKSSRSSVKVDNGLTVNDGPSKYKVFATNAEDCADASRYRILFEDNSGTPFSLDDEAKSGMFNNTSKYRCYGILVTDTPGRYSGEHWVNMSALAFYSPEQIRYQDTFAIDLTAVPGVANSTSNYDAARNANAAFKHGTNYWHSGEPTLPQAVWFEFEEALIIIGYSFKSSRAANKVKYGTTINDGPCKYKVFATNAEDCSDTSQHVILLEDDTGTPFSVEDEAKSHIFLNRKKYRCYGIQVTDTPGRHDGEKWVNMSALTFYTPEQVLYQETFAVDIQRSRAAASATSYYSPFQNADAAFKNGSSFWHSGTPDLPQAVWVQFDEPIVIVGFSFKSSRSSVKVENGLTVNDGPSKYKVFATNAEDCEDVSRYRILFEDNSGTPFSLDDEAKSGMFNNISKYRCYGILVTDTPGRYNGEHWVNMSSLTLYSPEQISYQDKEDA